MLVIMAVVLGICLRPSGKVDLFRAVQRGDADLVRRALMAGQSPDVVRPGGMTPLIVAAQYGSIPCVAVLLEYGANVNHRTSNVTGGHTPLHVAAYHEHVSMIEFLLDNGANIGARNANGRTTLHQAVLMMDRASAKALLDAGACAEIRDAYGGTPLLLAVTYGDRCSVELLLQHGANPNTRDAKGRTSFDVAAGNRRVLDLLAKFGNPKHIETSGTNEGS